MMSFKTEMSRKLETHTQIINEAFSFTIKDKMVPMYQYI